MCQMCHAYKNIVEEILCIFFTEQFFDLGQLPGAAVFVSAMED